MTHSVRQNRVLRIVPIGAPKGYALGTSGWCSALSGAYDLIVLDREPATYREGLWIEEEVRARLAPGGLIAVVLPA